MHSAAGDLEARVAEAVQRHRPELAALVHERVSAEVDKLVGWSVGWSGPPVR